MPCPRVLPCPRLRLRFLLRPPTAPGAAGAATPDAAGAGDAVEDPKPIFRIVYLLYILYDIINYY